MYAEKYDEAMWYRARDEYLTQKKYEDDETIRKLKQENRNSQMERPFNLNLSDQILYGALANSSGFGDGSGRSSINCIADRVRTAEEQIAELKKENEELKRKVLLQQEAGYYQRHTSTHGDINTDDAAFDHYWSVQDNDLTLWKVPRHLAEVKSAQTGYHGAVEQAFYDECFGEQYGKLKWMRVREMTQADLVSGGWEPETNEDAEAEAKLDDTLIGLIAVRQQNEFEKGEHDKPWCAEAEEQFRELLMCMPFEGKQKLQLKYNAEN